MINFNTRFRSNLDISSKISQRSKKRKYDEFNLHVDDPLAFIQSKSRKIQLKDKPTETEKKVQAFVISTKTSHSTDYLGRLYGTFKEEARQLENLMEKKQYTVVQRHHIRTLFLRIYDHSFWSENRKMAEIGLLYFLIANTDNMPKTEDSFVEQQAHELEQSIKTLKKEHKSLCHAPFNKLLSSGSVNYMRRFFVRMIFCFGKGFNLGGCYAVLELLKTPLCLLLTEEQKVQIETVLKWLIHNSKFRELFEEIGDIHPDMKQWVRIDENLPKDDPIMAIHVQWALLNTLFYLPVQYQEGNCYALATEMNIQRQNPDILLLLLKEILRKGTFTFDGKEIPISPLLSFIDIYREDYSVYMNNKKATSLMGFDLASHCFPHESTLSGAMQRRKEELDKIIEKHFGIYSSSAKELFLSFKLNFLSRCALVVLQFIALNSTKTRYIENKKSFSSKKELIKDLEELVFVFLFDLVQENTLSSLKKSFSQALSNSLFLFDYTDFSPEIKNKRICYKHHTQGFILKREKSAYDPFMKIRRLFYLSENDELKPIDSLTDLGIYFSEIVDHLQHINDSNELIVIASILKNFFRLEEFKKRVAKVISQINFNRSNIDWNEYYESDSLFLISNGGDCGPITHWNLIDSRYITPIAFKATNLSTLISFLLKRISEYETIYRKNLSNIQSSFLLFSSKKHTFNLLPWNFREFLHTKNFSQFLSDQVYSPGNSLLSSDPTEDQKLRVLCQVFGQSKGKLVYLELITSYKKINFKNFRKKTKSYIPVRLHEKFNLALDRVIEEISIEQVNTLLSDILASHGIFVEREMHQKISKYFTNKINEYLNPYDVATLLQKALVLHGLPFIQKNELEKTIRQKFGFPQVINLGNLNWIEKLEEKPTYSYCIIKYDYRQADLNMYERVKEKDIPFDSSFVDTFYELMEIFFES